MRPSATTFEDSGSTAEAAGLRSGAMSLHNDLYKPASPSIASISRIKQSVTTFEDNNSLAETAGLRSATMSLHNDLYKPASPSIGSISRIRQSATTFEDNGSMAENVSVSFDLPEIIPNEPEPQLERNTEEFEPPNGGWGWVVTFAAFVINVVLIGSHNCFGLLYLDLVDEFDGGLSKTGKISVLYVLVFVFIFLQCADTRGALSPYARNNNYMTLNRISCLIFHRYLASSIY